MKVDLIIFDLDGTLADTRQDLTNAVNYVLNKFEKGNLDVDAVTGYVGNGINKLLERVLNNRNPFANFNHLIHSSDFRQDWFDFRQRQLEQYVWREIEYGINRAAGIE